MIKPKDVNQVEKEIIEMASKNIDKFIRDVSTTLNIFKEYLRKVSIKNILPLIESLKIYKENLDFFFEYDEEIVRDLNHILQIEKNDNTYFRGIGDSEWSLVPSIIVKEETDSIEVKDYDLNSIIIDIKDNKYAEFKENSIYDFFAKRQHYITKTMLIDFSTDFWIAVWFALEQHLDSPKSLDKDKAIFMFQPLCKTAVISDHDKTDEYVSKCTLRLINGEKEEIKKKDFTKLMELDDKIPRAKLLTAKCNDNLRAERQKGVFLCLTDCSIINNNRHIYFKNEIKKEFKIIKYIIPRGLCDELSELLRIQKPDYTIENLLIDG